jgi:hypothetical protein
MECPFALIIEMSPFSGKPMRVLTRQQKEKEVEQARRVKQHYVEVFSSSPLYQARAAKDPNFWSNWNSGIVHM